MEINEQKTERCVIIGITGRLDTTNYNLLEKKLMELIEGNNNKILVDCSKMDYISSSGLRILLMGLKKITLLKGKFVLCGLQENIHEIFEISGFTSIFEIYPSQEDAVKVF
jgi:anti-anti-sigma factor